MPRMQIATILLIAGCWTGARADFSYKQTTKMTGGMMMKFAGMMSGARISEPNSSTVAVKGSKMANIGSISGTIIDVEAQTITTLDFDQKRYWVRTFDEIRKTMDEAFSQSGLKGSDLKVDVRDGGNTKTLLGRETHDKVFQVTMPIKDPRTGNQLDMKVSSDLYLATGISGTDQLKEFHKKMSGIAWAPGGLPMLNRPEVAKATAEVMKAAGEMNGFPLMTVVSVHGTIPGMPDMSRFGGAPAPASSKESADDTLIEMTTEVTSTSTEEVQSSMFEIPAGFTKTDPPAAIGGRRR